MVGTLIFSWDGLVSGANCKSQGGEGITCKGFTEKETCQLTLCDPPDGILMSSGLPVRYAKDVW